MKKPVKRATLLEEVLADLMEAEDILASLESANALEPLHSETERLGQEHRSLKLNWARNCAWHISAIPQL